MTERYKRANRLPPGGAALEVSGHSFPLRVEGERESAKWPTAFFLSKAISIIFVHDRITVEFSAL